MKIFSSAIHLVWLIVLVVLSLASPIAASEFSSAPVLFAYDGQNPVRMAYDGGFLTVVDYDSAAVLSTTEEAHPTLGASSVLGKLSNFLAPDSAAIRWGPLNGPGPLGADTAATFRGGSYTESALSEDTTLYRVYGGNAGPLGSYWTRTAPAGPLQSTIDSALNPAWGNTAQNVSTIVVPKGTTIYEGFAAPQGGLLGGGSQVYIPKVNPTWLINP